MSTITPSETAPAATPQPSPRARSIDLDRRFQTLFMHEKDQLIQALRRDACTENQRSYANSPWAAEHRRNARAVGRIIAHLTGVAAEP